MCLLFVWLTRKRSNSSSLNLFFKELCNQGGVLKFSLCFSIVVMQFDLWSTIKPLCNLVHNAKITRPTLVWQIIHYIFWFWERFMGWLFTLKNPHWQILIVRFPSHMLLPQICHKEFWYVCINNRSIIKSL